MSPGAVRRVALATRNPGKLAEFRRLLRKQPWELLDLDQAGFTGPLDEPGTTYLQNATAKAEAVCAATINAAHSVHAAGRVGSLEIDKAADLLILSTSDYRDLAYQLGTNLVHTTIKRGEVRYRSG